MEEKNDLLDPGMNNNNVGGGKVLPNSTAALVLGICSIVTCWLYAVPGVACGIIAIVLFNKDKKRFIENPGTYLQSSYNNGKAGMICGIIGLCLSVLFLIYIIVILSIVSSTMHW